jgi:hypothetical protein
VSDQRAVQVGTGREGSARRRRICRAGIWRLGCEALRERRHGAREAYSYDCEGTVPQEPTATHIFHFPSSADVDLTAEI